MTDLASFIALMLRDSDMKWGGDRTALAARLRELIAEYGSSEILDDTPLNNGKLITEAHFEKQITNKEVYARYDQERRRCIEITAEAYANGIVFTVLYGTGKEEPKGILS